MARLASIAKAGYFPIPAELLPSVARAVMPVYPDEGKSYADRFGILDPCAGEGTAVIHLLQAWTRSYHRTRRTLSNAADRALHPTLQRVVLESPDPEASTEYPRVYAIELEATRHATLLERSKAVHHGTSTNEFQAIRGDAFTVELRTTASTPGVNVLYLNPPYDLDHEVGRLEERWLARFSDALMPGGVLIFVVPHYALTASIDTLARRYSQVQVCRFPDPHHAVYKQVILYARRSTDLLAPDAAVAELVRRAAADPLSLPLLDAVVPYELKPSEHPCRFLQYFPEARAVDTQRVRSLFKPWHTQVRRKGVAPVSTIRVAGAWRALCLRIYPMACTPRPSYIAAAIASGVFNGSKVEPDDPAKFPPIYVKGTFAKKYHTTRVELDEDGRPSKQVQVQYPKLEITVLDGSSYTYHDLSASAAVNPSHTSLPQFTVGDLFARYSTGMMRAFRERCPVLHDPADPTHHLELPAFPRRLFDAQAEAVRATCKLLDKPDKAVLVLGQIGSGKSTVALAAAHARGAKRVLIMCPPHLLTSWTDQCGYVVPWAKVLVLDSPDALRSFAQETHPEMVVGVMSREAAKLGHAFEGLSLDIDAAMSGTPLEAAPDPHGLAIKPLARSINQAEATRRYRCPECGTAITSQPEDCADKRLRCKGLQVVFKNEAARIARRLAWVLATRFPHNGLISQYIDAKVFNQTRARSLYAETRVELDRHALMGITEAVVIEMRRQAAKYRKDESGTRGAFRQTSGLGRALVLLLASLQDEALTLRCYTAAVELLAVVSTRVDQLGSADRDLYLAFPNAVLVSMGPDNLRRYLDEQVSTLYTPEPEPEPEDRGPEPEDQRRCIDWILAGSEARRRREDWVRRERESRAAVLKPRNLHELYNDLQGSHSMDRFGLERSSRSVAGQIETSYTLHSHSRESDRALSALTALTSVAEVKRDKECGSPLYQGVPRPRRYPLAKLIKRRYRRTFDFLIVDEGHEYSNQDSAQSQAAQSLYSLGLPTLLLTGSIMNGYASSLFIPCWYMSSAFRAMFQRDQLAGFVETYGYLKKTITERKAETRYGAVTDRQDPKESFSQAPGVMPVALLKFILPLAVTLQLEDLKLALPSITESTIEVWPTALQRTNYNTAIEELIERIKKDRKDPDRRGKLFGQMSELPSYLDRCTVDTGNRPDGSYVIAYPENTSGAGGEVVAAFDGMPASTVLPKERALLSFLMSETAEGRKSMVFVWHTELMPRLKRLIDAAGLKCVILDADKVPAKKREVWINKEVIRKGVEVLLVNPVAVSTGLNNLVTFCNGVWYEGPACNPITRRQAQGRLYRIGQTKPVKIVSMFYDTTLQRTLHELLLLKVGVSEAADGLDPETALQAAGVGDVDLTAGQSIGELLFDMLTAART